MTGMVFSRKAIRDIVHEYEAKLHVTPCWTIV
jgi:hypothetical protein